MNRCGASLPAAAAAALLALTLLSGAAAGREKGKKMETIEQLKAAMGQLNDGVFAARDDASVEPWEEHALSLGFNGLLLAAPKRVDLDAGTPLNALVLSADRVARQKALPWRANAVIVATDLDSGRVFAADAFVVDPGKSPPDGKAAAPPLPPLPAPLSADARNRPGGGGPRSAGTVWIDVLPRLALPPGAQRLALHVLHFDQASNAALTTLVRGGGAAPAGMAALTAQQLVDRIRGAGTAPHGLPKFYKVAETPALNAAGAAFTLTRHEAVAGEAPLPMHGAMRLPATTQTLVRPAPEGSPPVPTPGPVAAVLRCMVLVVAANQNRPWQIPLDIPIWSDKPLAPGDMIEAAFSVDLAATLPKAAGTYQVYLVAGQHLIGPRALTLTSPR